MRKRDGLGVAAVIRKTRRPTPLIILIPSGGFGDLRMGKDDHLPLLPGAHGFSGQELGAES
jgi:hypothetical protein